MKTEQEIKHRLSTIVKRIAKNAKSEGMELGDEFYEYCAESRGQAKALRFVLKHGKEKR